MKLDKKPLRRRAATDGPLSRSRLRMFNIRGRGVTRVENTAGPANGAQRRTRVRYSRRVCGDFVVFFMYATNAATIGRG